MQAGLSKTPMHLAAVYIYIFAWYLDTCVAVAKNIYGASPRRARFFWLCCITMELRHAKGKRILEGLRPHCHRCHVTTLSSRSQHCHRWGAGWRQVECTTLSSLSQHCHRCHIIVIDVTTLLSTSYEYIGIRCYQYIKGLIVNCYLETHPTIIVVQKNI